MRLLKESERICREMGNKDGLGKSLANQALVLRARGDLANAMELLKELEPICLELRDHSLLQWSLCHQVLLAGNVDSRASATTDKERGAVNQAPEGWASILAALGGNALMRYAKGDFEDGMKLMKEQEGLCRELGDKAWLRWSLGGQATALSNQSLILRDKGDLDGAMKLLKEQECICRELGDLAGLKESIGRQMELLRDTGDPQAAAKLFLQHVTMRRALGEKVGRWRAFVESWRFLNGK
jgi:tetratricopeptide (TPR) repeat protein